MAARNADDRAHTMRLTRSPADMTSAPCLCRPRCITARPGACRNSHVSRRCSADPNRPQKRNPEPSNAPLPRHTFSVTSLASWCMSRNASPPPGAFVTHDERVVVIERVCENLRPAVQHALANGAGSDGQQIVHQRVQTNLVHDGARRSSCWAADAETPNVRTRPRTPREDSSRKVREGRTKRRPNRAPPPRRATPLNFLERRSVSASSPSVAPASTSGRNAGNEPIARERRVGSYRGRERGRRGRRAKRIDDV